MGEELYWIYAWNIVVNSALSFFTAILLIELSLFLLRVNHPRVKAICRAIPFFKIPLDLCLYHFSNWALLHGANPLSAETGTRQLTVMLNPLAGIQLSMQHGETFSVADLIALSVDPLLIRALIILALAGSTLVPAQYIVRLLKERKYLLRILQECSPLELPQLKPSLVAWMEKKQIVLALSNGVTSPCIAGNTILFPASLVPALSQEEIEAVIAHELAHTYWKDWILRLLYSSIASLFWWIPSRWWQKRVEEMQEQASDALIERFGISELALAEAVLKTVKIGQEMPTLLVFPFVGVRVGLKRRMERILHKPPKLAKKWTTIQYPLLIASLLTILFGRLWIF